MPTLGHLEHIGRVSELQILFYIREDEIGDETSKISVIITVCLCLMSSLSCIGIVKFLFWKNQPFTGGGTLPRQGIYFQEFII